MEEPNTNDLELFADGPSANLFSHYSNFFNDGNVILSGNQNTIEYSRRCSVIQGSHNIIDGKYNCHIIGDFMGINEFNSVDDHSFNVGCANGIKSMGKLTIQRGGANIAGFSWISGGLYIAADGVRPYNPESVVEDGGIRAGVIQSTADIIAGFDIEYAGAPSAGNIIAKNNITAGGDVISSSTSDTRLKDNQKILKNCLEKLGKINAISFTWNDQQNTFEGNDIGLIAQEVQSIAPEIVVEKHNGYLGLKYEKMVPILVGAIKEQQELILKLQQELTEIKKHLAID